MHATLLSIKRATCPTHLTILAVIIPVQFGEEYTSRISSLCSLLQGESCRKVYTEREKEESYQSGQNNLEINFEGQNWLDQGAGIAQ
jgi:hypothetical protein